MFNTELLKIEITFSEYEQLCKQRDMGHYSKYLQVLPQYEIGHCPFCKKANIEKFDTYSFPLEHIFSPETSLTTEAGVVYHCEHFIMVEPFIFVPSEDQTTTGQWKSQYIPAYFKERQPAVVGFALEHGIAKGVIHALPVCEPKRGVFLPKYTLFMISYYSEDSEAGYLAFLHEGMSRTSEPESGSLVVRPRENESYWLDLSYWVQKEMLYWIDVDVKSGLLHLRTHEINTFPYKSLEKLVSK